MVIPRKTVAKQPVEKSEHRIQACATGFARALFQSPSKAEHQFFNGLLN